MGRALRGWVHLQTKQEPRRQVVEIRISPVGHVVERSQVRIYKRQSGRDGEFP